MADTTALKNRIRAAIKANDNQEITGPVLQQILLDIVDEIDLNPELQNEAQQRQAADTQLNNLITNIKSNIDNGYVYAGIAIPSIEPVSGKVFYIATAAGTYTNFGNQVLTQGINILCYNGSEWNYQQFISIDDKPTNGSNSLVKSGGIYPLNQKVESINNVLTVDNSVYELTTHSFYAVSTYKRSDYIPVYAGQKISYRLFGSNTAALIAFFNITKQFVIAVAGTYNGTYVVGEGVFECPADGYIVVGCSKENLLDAYVQLSPNISAAMNTAIKCRNALFDIANLQSWAFGYLTDSDMASGNITRIVTINIIYADNDIRLTTDMFYDWYLYFYNSYGSRISKSDTWQNQEYIIPKGTYFRVNMRKNDDSNLLLTDYSHLHLQKLSGIVGEIYNSIKGNIDWNDILLTGTVSPVSSGWEYSDYMAANRVCINPNKPLVLKAGSIFHVPNGYKIFILYRANGIYYVPGVWTSGDFICPIDGEYVFTYSKSPESAFTEPTNAEKISSISLIIKGTPATNDNLLQLSEKNANLIAKKNNIISVARLGYMPNSMSTPPEHSIASYIEAYKHGYRYMLVDVRWTSDNIPVCLHNETINAVARNTDGSVISTDIRLDSLTLAQVDEYDFGIIKGSQYAGQKIMRLAEFIRWCKIMNCIPILEVKDVVGNNDTAKKDSLIEILKQYRMERDVIFDADAGYLTSQSLHALFPYAAIGRTVVRTTDFTGEILTETLNVKSEHNRVIWFLWLADIMVGAVSETMLNVAFENDIDIYLTEVPNYASFQSFITDENNLAAKYVAITGGIWDEYMNAMNL